jgi:hypothetical protein
MATKKLSEALRALTTPEFGAEVEMPALSLNGTTIMPTGAELNYVDGVTSNIQTQLNAKAASTHAHAGTDITSGTIAGARLPAMSTTAQGSVPASMTATGSQVLADNGWVNKNTLYTAYQTLTEASPVVWDMLTGYNATITLTGNRTLSITNIANGMSGCLIVKQNAGGCTLTLPAGSKLQGATALTLTSAASSVDILTFTYDGTNYWWSQGANYLTVT